MKAKRLISAALTLALTVTMLAACGGNSAGETSSSSGAGAANGGATVDPVNIRFSATYQENETGGQIITYFKDYLEEASGGAITVEVTWGGTLYDSVAELEGVSQGGTDMVALGHARHTAATGELMYLSFPDFAPGGTQAALDYFDYIMFDNPETAALVEEEATEWNIKYLNVIAGGANAFCATYDFEDLDSLASGSSIGMANAGGSAKFEAVGFKNIVSVIPPDVYDALDRGTADCSQMGFAPMVNGLNWYEVTKCWALDGTYTAGNPFTVNLDFWNSLSADQQALIQEAADATEDYSATIYDDSIDADKQKVIDNGCTFVDFSDDDIDKWWSAVFDATAEEVLGMAEGSEKYDGIVTIYEAAAEKTNHDCGNLHK